MSTSTDTPGLPGLQVGLAALFVTALVTAQLTATKVLMLGLPFSIPVSGDAIIFPGAALAYALTFFASDCYAELYGKRAAQVLVNVGFLMNFVMLALVWAAVAGPVFPGSPVGAETFAAALTPATGVVVGSLAAYVLSQNWDVLVFHYLRDRTDGKRLWLRNIASTASSQLIDTVVFIGVAFLLFQGVPLDLALSLIVGQYLLKVVIALVDTPFVYAVVGFARSRAASADPVTAD
jgi:uncharacterized integral membrane protein (TIGR00697 family)